MRQFQRYLPVLAKGNLPQSPIRVRSIPYISTQYEVIDGVLFHFYESRAKYQSSGTRRLKQLALSKVLRSNILHHYHDQSGLFGAEKMFGLYGNSISFQKCFKK